MFTADAHCDTLYAISVSHKPAEEIAVTYERLEKGNVGLQTFALFAGTRDQPGTPKSRVEDMLRASKALKVPLIRSKLPQTPPESPAGVLSVEGGEALGGDINELFALAREGVRMIALCWNYENEIGFPGVLSSNEPLKGFGRELISEMDKLGILTDVSHLNDAGFFDAAARTKLPLVASHSNLRSITNASRNLTPEQVKVIVEKRGFIGVNFYSKFLASGRRATLDDVIRHIDGMCELGACDNLGFGSDFDGIDEWPEGLDNPSRFPVLIDLLAKRGYTQKQLEGFAGMNLWRVYKDANFG
ncbi:MAG: membrane dipeptidase [Clostridia bacterium]|nr:membrane dipeptidase [Clostridia bacterium]